ncbi:MAG: DUF2891 family protein, partial [Acidimicrobiales bacterium]
SGTDFLSPALAEAELMSLVLDADGFRVWCNGFLPGWRTGCPTALFSPVSVTDDTDGHLAHLHGLNLSRAWGWRRVAEALGGGTNRLWAAAARHAEVGLPAASGTDYMVEHWLAAYAGLVLGPLGAGRASVRQECGRARRTREQAGSQPRATLLVKNTDGAPKGAISGADRAADLGTALLE